MIILNKTDVNMKHQIDSVQDKDYGRALDNEAMNFRVP